MVSLFHSLIPIWHSHKLSEPHKLLSTKESVCRQKRVLRTRIIVNQCNNIIAHVQATKNTTNVIILSHCHFCVIPRRFSPFSRYHPHPIHPHPHLTHSPSSHSNILIKALQAWATDIPPLRPAHRCCSSSCSCLSTHSCSLFSILTRYYFFLFSPTPLQYTTASFPPSRLLPPTPKCFQTLDDPISLFLPSSFFYTLLLLVAICLFLLLFILAA